MKEKDKVNTDGTKEQPKGQPREMWKLYRVELSMEGNFAAALPHTIEEIKNMLQNRMPTNPPANYVPIDELTEQVGSEVGITPEPLPDSTEPVASEEEFKYGWATFKKDSEGLYYEGRCLRGHIKDCANQVKDLLGITGLKAKVSNKVYVTSERISLGREEIDGTEQRFVQVMTRQGPRSTIKYIDYLTKPILVFYLKVLNDGVITEEILKAIFDYGSVHGLGQERSQGWGRYSWNIHPISL